MTRLWQVLVHPISRHFRRKRGALLAALFPGYTRLRVCDLGGSVHFWEKLGPGAIPHDLTVLNIGHDGQSAGHDGSADGVRVVLYDGMNIPYPDGHFDLLICNSVIEHVPPERREALGREIVRCCRGFFVQTPAFSFPVEQHFIFPFLHWLPRTLARRLVILTPWFLLSMADRAHRNAYFDEVQILRLSEFRQCFPEGSLTVEKAFGLSKSYILHRPIPATTAPREAAAPFAHALEK